MVLEDGKGGVAIPFVPLLVPWSRAGIAMADRLDIAALVADSGRVVDRAESDLAPTLLSIATRLLTLSEELGALAERLAGVHGATRRSL